jgi:hypothetical protein
MDRAEKAISLLNEASSLRGRVRSQEITEEEAARELARFSHGTLTRDGAANVIARVDQFIRGLPEQQV